MIKELVLTANLFLLVSTEDSFHLIEFLNFLERSVLQITWFSSSNIYHNPYTLAYK